MAATAVTSSEYYRQIRKAKKEYEKARDLVEDIVLSFDRELKREAEKLELIALKVEGSDGKADKSLKKIETVEKRIRPFEEQVGVINNSILQNSHTNANILSDLSGLELKTKNIEAIQETLKEKISGLEDQVLKMQIAPPEINIEQPIGVMPIKRDKVMAALNGTEISVLEMLSKEGSKTAPEIKERVKLSREHTARVMKKLYEGGYLEREADKIPFRYSIKKEMDSFMQKLENQP